MGKQLDSESEEIVVQIGPFPATPYDWFFANGDEEEMRIKIPCMLKEKKKMRKNIQMPMMLQVYFLVCVFMVFTSKL